MFRLCLLGVAAVAWGLRAPLPARRVRATLAPLAASSVKRAEQTGPTGTGNYAYTDVEGDDDFAEEEQESQRVRRLGDNDQEWMFFDVARINVKGGDGGDGCMAMRREFRIEFGGPSGGNGGAGGSVYIECDDSLNTLSMLRRKVHHRGRDGTNGKGDSRHGYR